ncbi:hypothetical protein PI125_g15906 [Phytophthora idaei]|nr:hypothetical protein PI125_g15906 [Phytophthora idaei]
MTNRQTHEQLRLTCSTTKNRRSHPHAALAAPLPTDTRSLTSLQSMPLAPTTAPPVDEVIDSPDTDTQPTSVAATPDSTDASPLLAVSDGPEDSFTTPDASSTDSPLPFVAEPLKVMLLAEAPLPSEPAPDEMDTLPPKEASLAPPLREQFL